MTLLQAILLGIVQGITEFLPVSSSGHLELAQLLLGLENLDKLILFDLACHLGTLLAIFYVFWNQILATFHDTTRLKQLAIAILPLFPLLLVLKPIKHTFDQPELLYLFFLITACLLFIGCRFGKEKSRPVLQKSRWRDALAIGIFQAGAIFPGVSRSGSTISGASLMGWSRQEAVLFSFLLAIPTILGGTTLEVYKLFKGVEASSAGVGSLHYLAGFITSFIVGIAALKLLIQVVNKDKMMLFVWYCLAISLFSFLTFTV